MKNWIDGRNKAVILKLIMFLLDSVGFSQFLQFEWTFLGPDPCKTREGPRKVLSD